MSALAASPLFLREAEVRRGWELMLFANTRLGRALDPVLAAHGLGRAHARALYFIGRQPGLPVGQLLRLLGVTKQSLGRTLTELDTRALVETRGNPDDRRQRLLRLTAAGAELDRQLFAALAAPLREAYQAAGQEAVSGFWRVLDALLPVEDRGLRQSLERGG